MLDFKAELIEESTEFKASFGEVHVIGGGASGVNSVNGKSGDVVLTASDVGAYTKAEVNEEAAKLNNALLEQINTKAEKSELPAKLSELEDDTTENKPIKYANEARTASWANGSTGADYALKADHAIHDGEYRIIHETYATKEELAQAIGEALEGDY